MRKFKDTFIKAITNSEIEIKEREKFAMFYEAYADTFYIQEIGDGLKKIHQSIFLGEVLHTYGKWPKTEQWLKEEIGPRYSFPNLEEYRRDLKFETAKYIQECIDALMLREIGLTNMSYDQRKRIAGFYDKVTKPFTDLKNYLIQEKKIVSQVEFSKPICLQDIVYCLDNEEKIYLWPMGLIPVSFPCLDSKDPITSEFYSRIVTMLKSEFKYENCPFEIVISEKPAVESIKFLLDNNNHHYHHLDSSTEYVTNLNIGYRKGGSGCFIRGSLNMTNRQLLLAFLQALGIPNVTRFNIQKTLIKRVAVQDNQDGDDKITDEYKEREITKILDGSSEKFYSENFNTKSVHNKLETELPYNDQEFGVNLTVGDKDMIDYVYFRKGDMCTAHYSQQKFIQYCYEIPLVGRVCNYCGRMKYHMKVDQRTVEKFPCVEGTKYNFDRLTDINRLLEPPNRQSRQNVASLAKKVTFITRTKPFDEDLKEELSMEVSKPYIADSKISTIIPQDLIYNAPNASSHDEFVFNLNIPITQAHVINEESSHILVKEANNIKSSESSQKIEFNVLHHFFDYNS